MFIYPYRLTFARRILFKMKPTLLSSWLALGTLVAGSPVLELNGFEKRATNSSSFNTLLIFGDSLSDNVCLPS